MRERVHLSPIKREGGYIEGISTYVPISVPGR